MCVCVRAHECIVCKIDDFVECLLLPVHIKTFIVLIMSGVVILSFEPWSQSFIVHDFFLLLTTITSGSVSTKPKIPMLQSGAKP